MTRAKISSRDMESLASRSTLDEINQIIVADEVQAVEQGPLGPDERAVAIAHGGDFPHRVICGDATDQAALRHLMGGDCAARLI